MGELLLCCGRILCIAGGGIQHAHILLGQVKHVGVHRHLFLKSCQGFKCQLVLLHRMLGSFVQGPVG